MRTYRSIRIFLKYRFASTVLRNPSIRGSRSYHSGVYFCFHRHYTCRRGMSICQTVTALSAIFEVARGLLSGMFEHAFFYIQTSSASSLNWMSGSLSVHICNNRLLNIFISDIRRGGSAALRTQFSLMQRKIMQDDGSLLAQIGASGGPLSIVSCSKR